MKKLVLITGAVLIACVFAGSFAASPQPRTAAAAIAETTAPQADGGFVIRDSGGRIAVFRRGESAPLLVTQTLTESLPRAEAQYRHHRGPSENPRRHRSPRPANPRKASGRLLQLAT